MTPAPLPPRANSAETMRRHWRVTGIVQGVGFRPWVCLTATRLGLTGEVGNDASGVWIEAEGSPAALDDLGNLLRNAPPPARVTSVTEENALTHGMSICTFRIAASRPNGIGASALAPDLAPCADCRRELLDPYDRRHHYPFLACARCGPRYTVTDSLPYDRACTSLIEFPLCPQCAAEYADPGDRRFHAEAIVCPLCGPRLRALAPDGELMAETSAAIDAAVAALEGGLIVAVHATGGFQLWVDATQPEAVNRLRERKHREAKPLAVMVKDLTGARHLAHLTTREEELLADPAAPIVLVPERTGSPLAAAVAPGCGTVGVCLPASPLQILLLERFSRPVVATSGNLSEEPLCHEPENAVARLGAIADLLLVHNRKILQPADDPVLRVMAGEPRMLRYARGYSPAPAGIPLPVNRPGFAMGGQVKGTLAFVRDDAVVSSPHLGDQDTVLARERHATTASALRRLLRLEPQWVACDRHPDYAASVAARAFPLPRLEVQHHHAHLLAVLAEQPALPPGPVAGVIWDGSGYGPDGTVWGGEFLIAHGSACRRVGYLRRFSLPGGERAIREPRRSAFAWLWETLGPDVAGEAARHFGMDAGPMGRLCDGAAATLRTSSAGRLFDAVAALTGLCQTARYEGEAAILLETSAASWLGTAEPYPFDIRPSGEAAVRADVILTGHSVGWRLDLPELPDMAAWEVNTAPMAAAIWQAVCNHIPAAQIAARFHVTLAAIAATVAECIGLSTVVLGGGCFQNAILLERTAVALAARGHQALIPARFPANDGGLAIGQAFAGAWLHPPT